MKNYKILIAIGSAMLVALMASCSNEYLAPSNVGDDPEVEILNNVDAQKAFAEILSKALSNSEEVRVFLKNEALAQFDNDYDVFYPFVKDKEVVDGKSFRDILLSYCDNEQELIRIEESSLLLNILVPDLTLFWDFDAEKWNTGDDEIAVISRDDDTNTLYENGEVLGSLDPDDVPAFPCLVVKNNERLRVSNKATRAGDATYEFADDAFDPSKTPQKTRSYVEYMPLETPDSEDPYVMASDLDPAVIRAYNEFKGIRTAYHRDHIYYGIDKSNQPGFLDRNTYEEILMFKIDVDQYMLISDQAPDPALNLPFLNAGKGNGGWSKEQILAKVWKDGRYEIVIKAFIAPIGNPAGEEHMTISLRASDLFSIDRTNVHYTSGALFRRKHYIYHLSVDDLSSRWVRPRDHLGRVISIPWDISSTSMNMNIYAYEKDTTTTEKVTKSVTIQHADSANFELSGNTGSGEHGGSLSAKVGYGLTNTKTTQTTIETTRTLDSEELGWTFLSYTMPVIVSDTEKISKGYKLHYVNTGGIKFVFAPVKL